MGIIKNGFTLIELLIVVAIIGILAAIAVPNFMNAQVRAKIARSQADMRSIGTAIESFRIDNGALLVDFYDEQDTAAIQRLQKWGLCSVNNFDDAVRNQRCIYANLTSPVAFISAIPDDPFFGKISNNVTDRLIEAFAGTYIYYDNEAAIPGDDHYVPLLSGDNGKPFNVNPLGLNQWVLLGIGPDSSIGDTDLNRRGIPYDATNGLRSEGDLMTRSG